jgi:hypothetical protein
MSTLTDLMKRDTVRAAWFWVDSIDNGRYSERERFDLVFTRETGYVVGGGEMQRRTLYVPGVQTEESKSRRNNGNRVIKGDDTDVLYNLLCAALAIDSNPAFPAWAQETRDCTTGYRDALADYEAWEQDKAMARQLRVWLGDAYDEYTMAAIEC